jgi:hypothetical protein
LRDSGPRHAIATRCCEAVADAGIAHEGLAPAARLTIRLGVGTTIPDHAEESMPFIERSIGTCTASSSAGMTASLRGVDVRDAAVCKV